MCLACLDRKLLELRTIYTFWGYVALLAIGAIRNRSHFQGESHSLVSREYRQHKVLWDM
jgi:hypothetical protein